MSWVNKQQQRTVFPGISFSLCPGSYITALQMSFHLSEAALLATSYSERIQMSRNERSPATTVTRANQLREQNVRPLWSFSKPPLTSGARGIKALSPPGNSCRK